MKLYSMALSATWIASLMSMNESPLLMWILMEISNAIFIMMYTLTQNNLNTPPLLFLIQFFSSSFILLSIIKTNNPLMSFGIMVKLGMFPAHNWFPMIISKTSWTLTTYTMIIPKIQPFLFMETLTNYNLMLVSTILTPLISTIKLIMNNNTKIIMALSSIIHSSWMTLIQMISFKTWMLYFILYSINMIMLCSMMSKKSLTMNKMTKTTKTIMMTMLFSTMGLPPLSTFAGKLMACSFAKPLTTLALLSLMVSSAASITYYSRIFIHSIFMHKTSYKPNPLQKTPQMNLKWILFMMILIILL